MSMAGEIVDQRMARSGYDSLEIQTGSGKQISMQNPKTLSANEQSELIKRLRNGSQPEVQTYVASLKQRFGKHAQSVHAGRKVIDSAMNKRSLTDVLYQSREQ